MSTAVQPTSVPSLVLGCSMLDLSLSLSLSLRRGASSGALPMLQQAGAWSPQKGLHLTDRGVPAPGQSGMVARALKAALELAGEGQQDTRTYAKRSIFTLAALANALELEGADRLLSRMPGEARLLSPCMKSVGGRLFQGSAACWRVT